MSDEKSVGIKPIVSAIIGDIEFNDVIDCTATHDLNGIPQCSITVAMGRDPDDAPATIHAAIDKLKPGTKAFVYSRFEDRGAINMRDSLVGKSFMSFEGRYVGLSFSRSGNTVGIKLHFVHWLNDFNTTSATNSNFFPGSPYNAQVAAVVPAGSGGTAGSWTQIVPTFVNEMANRLQDDAWVKVLHPWLKFLAEQNRLEVDNSLLKNKAKRNGNATALAALERMINFSAKSNYKALKLRFHGADTTTIGDCLAAALTQVSVESWQHSTLWGKLVSEWAPLMMLSIVPRVTDAIPIPCICPIKTPFTTIRSNEYFQIGRVAEQTQVLLGVGIMHGATSSTGADGVGGTEVANPQFLSNLAGWYPPQASSDDDENGVIMIKNPPHWLTSNVEYSRFAVSTAGADGQPIGGVMAPGVGAAPGGRNPAAGAATTGSFLDEYARHWFAAESIRGRTAELAGKLRFDIAPGSQVRIEGKGEAFVEGDKTAVPLHAVVMRVSYTMNCQTLAAGTSFSLAHIRTEAENDAALFVVEQPPLYQDAWLGGPLVDDVV